MLGASRVGGALIYVSAPCGLSYQYISASTTVRLIRFIHMPRDTGLRCGCCRCEHAGKETVSRSTYNRHKQSRTDQLSSQFQLFVANNSAPSTSNVPIPSTSISISPDNATPGIQNQDDTSASSLSNRTGASGEAAPWSGVTPSVNGIRLVEKSVESVRPQVMPLNVRNSRYPIRRVGHADALMANISCSFLTSLYVDSYSIRARKNHQLNFITITYQMKGSRHLNVNIHQRYTLPAPTHNLMCKQIHSNDKLKTRRPWHQEQP